MPVEMKRETWLPLLLTILLTSLGGYGLWVSGSEARWTGVASVCIFAYTVAILMVWAGYDLFLYTPLWQPFLLFMASGVGRSGPRLKWLGMAACGTLCITELIYNTRYLEFVLHAL